MSRRPYRLGKRAETAEQTRQRILDAGRELIVEAGFHPVSVDDVAARARVGRATLYRHFGSKRGLLEAVAWDLVAAAGLQRLDEARRLPDVVEALHTFVRENCRMFAALGEGFRATLDLARHEPEVTQIVDVTYYGRRIESLRHLAGRLEDEGALAPGWTRDQVVDVLMVLTSLEPFEALTERRARSVEAAADTLVAMTDAFVTRPRVV